MFMQCNRCKIIYSIKNKNKKDIKSFLFYIYKMISQMLSYINKFIEDFLAFLSIRKSSLACFQHIHIPEETSE